MQMGNLPRRKLRLVIAVLGSAALVSGCSTAGLPNFKPAKPVAVAIVAPSAAPKPQKRPVLVASTDDFFAPLAFAEPKAKLDAKISAGPADVNALIDKYASVYNVPASLIHRVVRRESGYNPRAKNGPYLGLMQIRHDTARSMGYSGSASGLLDAETNLRYAVKYLRGAYVVGGYNADRAVRNYSRGYYYDAKRAGLLEEVGLR